MTGTIDWLGLAIIVVVLASRQCWLSRCWFWPCVARALLAGTVGAAYGAASIVPPTFQSE